MSQGGIGRQVGRSDVKIWTKIALAAGMTVMAAGPTFAGFWVCPEIDGPAGASAVAALVSIGMVAYHRLTR
jgi:hypothetical protein